jgi:hypothetical protein
MSKQFKKQKSQKTAQLLAAISRWDNEGGAGPDGPQERSSMTATPCREIPAKPKKPSKGLSDNESSFHN